MKVYVEIQITRYACSLDNKLAIPIVNVCHTLTIGMANLLSKLQAYLVTSYAHRRELLLGC